MSSELRSMVMVCGSISATFWLYDPGQVSWPVLICFLNVKCRFWTRGLWSFQLSMILGSDKVIQSSCSPISDPTSGQCAQWTPRGLRLSFSLNPSLPLFWASMEQDPQSLERSYQIVTLLAFLKEYQFAVCIAFFCDKECGFHCIWKINIIPPNIW